MPHKLAKTRVLIVEDSLTVRKRLCEILQDDSALEIVGEAGDGKRAIELCQELRPDVITMDVMLPVMSGIAATEYIMAYCPTPILLLTASINPSKLFKIYDGFAAGALDVLEKKLGDEKEAAWEANLIAAIKQLGRLRNITHPSDRLRARGGANQSPAKPGDETVLQDRQFNIIAVGASTGGPAAIIELLRALPNSFPLPILLVLHIGKPFGIALADWLNRQTHLRVSYATEGQPVASANGSVVMAPPDKHLVIRDRRMHLVHSPERHSCRPSVDVFFESVASAYGPRAIGCLLTGMGRDGAAGLLQIRKARGCTIAQDEATSVAYGMPREAALLGAPERVLALNEIGPTLAMLATLNREEKIAMQGTPSRKGMLAQGGAQ